MAAAPAVPAGTPDAEAPRETPERPGKADQQVEDEKDPSGSRRPSAGSAQRPRPERECGKAGRRRPGQPGRRQPSPRRCRRPVRSPRSASASNSRFGIDDHGGTHQPPRARALDTLPPGFGPSASPRNPGPAYRDRPRARPAVGRAPPRTGGAAPPTPVDDPVRGPESSAHCRRGEVGKGPGRVGEARRRTSGGDRTTGATPPSGGSKPERGQRPAAVAPYGRSKGGLP